MDQDQRKGAEEREPKRGSRREGAEEREPKRGWGKWAVVLTPRKTTTTTQWWKSIAK